MMRTPLLFLFIGLLVLGGCTEAQLFSHVAKKSAGTSGNQGNFKIGKPYKVEGKWYQPQEDYSLVETGIASWYGPGFHGKRTANGERFDQNELTAAHRTLQMPSLVRVTNLENGRSVVVRVNDRGPFKRGRIIDVSSRAAELLAFKGRGTARVRLEVLKDESLRIAEAAKRGEDTRGYELAMSEQRRIDAGGAPPARIEGKPVPETIQAATGYQTASLTPMPTVPGHLSKEGRFYPDPVVKQEPVSSTTIFIQTGAFTVQDNADALARKLQLFGNAQISPTMIGGRQFYRVRLPARDVSDADQLLSRLINSGHSDAMIVVE
jgi:rare lipoprotein A